MFAGNDVIAISSLGGDSGNFLLLILKGRPRLNIHVQLTLLVYLERFRRYSTYLFCWDFPSGGEILGFLGKMTPKTSNEKNTCWVGSGHFLMPNCVFWAIVREIISIRFACAGAQEIKKAGRSHKKCIFHVCVERPLAGGFQPNLADVFVSRTLSNVQTFIVITWKVSELWGVEIFMLPLGNQGRP